MAVVPEVAAPAVVLPVVEVSKAVTFCRHVSFILWIRMRIVSRNGRMPHVAR